MGHLEQNNCFLNQSSGTSLMSDEGNHTLLKPAILG
jgi:hypothetical protein